MTLLTTSVAVEYAGNATTLAFATGFMFTDNAQLVVTDRVDATGVSTTLAITTNYTVTGRNSPTGGTVTMVAAPATGHTLRIQRVTPRTQTTELRLQSAFNPEAIEFAMDRIVQMFQELQATTTTVLLYGSVVYDPASLVDGAGATTTVTVAGAALGDFAHVSFSLSLQGILLTAYVSAANTVSVRFQNESGGTLDLASGTLRAYVRPHT